MTFLELANRIKVKVDSNINRIELFRDAENDFIEKTLCTETFVKIDTSISLLSLEDGTTLLTTGDGDFIQITQDGLLVNLHEFPLGFVKEHRVEWDGVKLDPINQGTNIQLFDSSNEPITGPPVRYWIENEQLRIIPKPSQHGIIGLWFTNTNIDSESESPIIPAIEHLKLVNYVNATILEMDENERRAAYYWGKYNADAAVAREKYEKQRFKYGQIVDVSSEYSPSIQSRLNIVEP